MDETNYQVCLAIAKKLLQSGLIEPDEFEEIVLCQSKFLFLTNSSSFYIYIITLLELHVKKVIDRSLL
ncbi:SHOCT domain-containing protein [Dubosiella newyorkensis]|uniref:SHOCT domain-containing protein n=1 Tax=Dubosiella newyorkensis TaxID=1862672 RepID=UPI0032B2005D